MTEQEKQQAIISRREAAIKAIIATNAEISDEQFTKLMEAIGKSVTISVSNRTYDVDDEQYYESSTEFTETLPDFKFVEDERTGKRYLAFVVVGDENGDKIHPDQFDSGTWGDTHAKYIINIRSVPGWETILSRNKRGESLYFSTSEYGHCRLGYTYEDIEIFSASAKAVSI